VQIISMNGTVSLVNTVIQTNGGEGRGGAISVAGLQNVLINGSTLEAAGVTQGGQVRLASYAGDINYANSIVQTNGGSGLGGTIGFDAFNVLNINGQLLANSQSAKAGLITLEAKYILLDSQANLQATGSTGGGNILVGGDWQGSGTLRQAITVTMNQGAVIDASATQNGNGGKVVLWADVHNSNSRTEVHGSIYAKSGESGGQGGQVETSAATLNTDHVLVDTRAFDGTAGKWLLDPYNYEIGANGAADIVAALATSNVSISTTAGPSTSVRMDNSGSCSTCGDVILKSTGAIAYTGSNARSLTIKADGYINISANITSTNAALNVILWSDTGAIGGVGNGGYIYIAPGVTISTNGGKIVMAGGSDTNSDGIPDGYAWNAKSSGQAGVMLGDFYGTGSSVNLVSNGGDIIIRGKTSDSTGYPGISTQGAFKIDSGAGTITMNGTSSTGHGFEFVYGVAANYVINSASTSSTAISISGSTSRAGYTGAVVALRSGSYLIQSTGDTGGGIEIIGSNSATSNGQGYLIGSGGTAYILSKKGPITFTGSGGNGGFAIDGTIKLGSSSAVTINGVTSSVSSSTSNITFTSNYFGFGSGSAIATTGSLTIQPYSTSFAASQTLSNLTFTNSVSAFNLGKSGNTTGFTISSNVSSAGTITIYGGSVTLSNSTSITASGDISITANSSARTIDLGASSLIQSTGGSVTITSTNSASEIALYLNTSSQILASGAISITANSSGWNGLYTEGSTKIQSTGSTVDISTLGGIRIRSASSILAQGDLSIYSNDMAIGYTGIEFYEGSATIRSSGGNVTINSIGYHGIYLNDTSTTIRAYGDLKINALGNREIGIYGAASGSCAASPCGLVSDTGDITINAITKGTGVAFYLRNPIIANGTASLGKGNVTISATGKQYGIYGDGTTYGYVVANGNIDLIGYGGNTADTYGIYFGAGGPSLTASAGGLLRSVSGNITLSAFGYDRALYGNSSSTNIVALAGNVVVQGAALSTNSAGTFSAATNTAIVSSYDAIYSSITSAANPRTVMPSGFATANVGSAATAYFWGITWVGNIFAVNNPYTVTTGTAPNSGGSVTIVGSNLYAVTPQQTDTGSGVTIYDYGNVYAKGAISITGYAIGGTDVQPGSTLEQVLIMVW